MTTRFMNFLGISLLTLSALSANAINPIGQTLQDGTSTAGGTLVWSYALAEAPALAGSTALVLSSYMICESTGRSCFSGAEVAAQVSEDANLYLSGEKASDSLKFAQRFYEKGFAAHGGARVLSLEETARIVLNINTLSN